MFQIYLCVLCMQPADITPFMHIVFVCIYAQLNGPIEVIHLARVREYWQGGKYDLTVHQGENVEIIRVNNNPEGKWLARDMRGSSKSVYTVNCVKMKLY